MRYTSEHRAQTRQRILHIAAAAIRTHGISRVSLSNVMSQANLTNGGFYFHFESKDDLVAEAVSYMFNERYGRFLIDTNTPNAMHALNAFVDLYLSERHLKIPELGCPIPALAPEVQHMSKAAKERFTAGVDRLVEGLMTLLEKAGVEDPRPTANSILAELSGAISLARIAGEARSADALVASRKTLKRRLELLAGER